MDPDVTPEPKKAKAPLKNLLTPLKNLLTLFKNLLNLLKNILGVLKNLPIPKQLPIPKKLMIPAIAGAVLLIAGGVAFGVLHTKPKHAVATLPKAVASASVAPASVAPASVAPASVASAAKPSTACSGVVRDIYRQTVDEDPSVTLAEVRSEVLSSGISCDPVPEITAELKDLSPACRDMVQYTYLEVHDGHALIQVNDVREKVVEKSVACEHDRKPNIAAVGRHRTK